MGKFSTKWTDEQQAALRDLWARGWTGSQIAVVVGVSRCAVLGMARRQGLPKRGPDSGARKVAKQRMVRLSALGGAARKAKAKQCPKPTPASSPKPAPVEPPAKRMTKILTSSSIVIANSLRQAVRHPTRTVFTVEILGDPVTVGRPMIGAPLSRCRWPIDGDGPALCCSAAVVPGSSWCPAHRLVVYAAQEARRAAE